MIKYMWAKFFIIFFNSLIEKESAETPSKASPWAGRKRAYHLNPV
jgi:hypothetical protein